MRRATTALRDAEFIAFVPLFLALCSCDDGGTYDPLGYTVQILVEVDGNYRGHYCVDGIDSATFGAAGVSFYRETTDGFDLEWQGRDGELELRAEDDLGDDAPGPVLFHETFDESFGASRQVRRLQTDFQGHEVVIYVESLERDGSCSAAQHQQSDYEAGDGNTDAGSDAMAHPLNVPWLLDIHGTGAGDVWAVGFGGVVLHYDGDGWTQTVEDESVDLLHVWDSSPGGEIWLVERTGWAETEQRRLLRGRPGSWQEVDPGKLEGELVDRPWGTGPGDIWVTGYTGEEGDRYGVIHHFDGASWSSPAAGTGGHLDCVWGSGRDDIFVAGNDGSGYGGYIAHFADGQFDWNEYPDSWIGGLWGSGPNDVWAAGEDLLHYDGSEWTPTEKPPEYHMFHGVWGSGPDDFWAVGSQGTTAIGVSGVILHWDGAAWTEAAVTPLNELWNIWGSGPNDVWAVGSGAIYHFDGSEWTLTRAEEIAVSQR